MAAQKARGPSAPSNNKVVNITPPNFGLARFKLVGISPYVQAKFSAKAKLAMMNKMEAGPTAKKGKSRTARDFDQDYQDSIHYASEGWIGVPAAALRNACIDACRMNGFKMTHAKMSLFIEPDGLDATEGLPLVKLHAGKPDRIEMMVRNATGVCDIRVRPQWKKWEIRPMIRFDADQFTMDDVANLLGRAGLQVGIGEGRPFSRDGNGLGFGMFKIDGGDA